MGKKPVSFITKWKIIGAFQCNISNSTMAEKFGVSLTCVRQTIKTYQETGDVKEKQRTGRPKKLTDRGQRRFIRLCKSNRFSTSLELTRNLRT